jgi:hypothetical protein
MVAVSGLLSVSKIKRKQRRRELPLPAWAKELKGEIEDWCRGRLWWPRLLLLLFFLHVTVMHLKEPMYSDLFKGLNLGIHEMGHVVFAPLGEFMGICGGSLFQCLVPLASTFMFFRQRDYFGIAICFGWLSTNLFDVAVYAGDARALALPLVTPFKGGDETIHDWNYILDKLDLMHCDYLIAGGLRVLAVFCSLFCLSAGVWLVVNMMRTPRKKTGEAEEA